MYAGNVGFSQSLEMVVDAAGPCRVTFLINGDGAARAALPSGRGRQRAVLRLRADERLPEVLATGDVHLVPLSAGLGRVSVPSKTYSILAAGRPVLAAIDAGTEVPRMLAESGGGVCVPPDDPDACGGAGRCRRPGRTRRDGRGRAALGGVGGVAGGRRPGLRRPDRRA